MGLRGNGQRVIAAAGAAAMMATLLFGQNGAVQSALDCPLSPLKLPLFNATAVAIVASTPLALDSAPGVDDVAITAAMETIVTCANSANPAVANSIFTERYLASLFLDPATYLPAFELQLESESTQVVGTLKLDEVVSVTLLADGRVEVVAELHNDSESYTDTFVLAFVGGDWLIDGVPNLDPLP